ncbi:hypothetical protein [Paracoccus sp. (in: a-proteobacteria)]|uniref:hypothetical protein n=1 Tax=Paracoccus sp. TaxID=267 RepID=UPI0026DF2FD0|nr:hypothetical protein [Paracoccus sp. (in: a-proteobacteria)]MDO5648691.1 hypothetical protein [Paracoccus sp. (in: a-proteobacteria)]
MLWDLLNSLDIRFVFRAAFVIMYVYALLWLGRFIASETTIRIQAGFFVGVAAVFLIVGGTGSSPYASVSSGNSASIYVGFTVGIALFGWFMHHLKMRWNFGHGWSFRAVPFMVRVGCSVFVYLIGHHFAGFGVAEASLSAVFAGLALGAMGYTA